MNYKYLFKKFIKLLPFFLILTKGLVTNTIFHKSNMDIIANNLKLAMYLMFNHLSFHSIENFLKINLLFVLLFCIFV